MAKVAKLKEATLARDIRRLVELNVARKAISKEEEALKTKFRAMAGGADYTFSGPAGDVLVTLEKSTRIDLEAVRQHLGAKVSKFEVETTCEKVTVRPA